MNVVRSKKVYVQLMSVLLAGAFLTSFGISNAGACPSEISKEKEQRIYRQLQRQVRDHIVYPEQAMEQKLNGDVEVVFSVNKEGKIEVAKVNGDHELLKEIAYDQLNNQEVHIKECVHGKLFSVKVKYSLREI